MRNGRIRFWRMLRKARRRPRAAGVSRRSRTAAKRTQTMVHSKVMVIDDRFLRVGSANLNNRSMGADTECDLVDRGEEPRPSARHRRVRNRLLGDHCGVTADEVARALERQRDR